MLFLKIEPKWSKIAAQNAKTSQFKLRVSFARDLGGKCHTGRGRERRDRGARRRTPPKIQSFDFQIWETLMDGVTDDLRVGNRLLEGLVTTAVEAVRSIIALLKMGRNAAGTWDKDAEQPEDQDSFVTTISG